MHDFPTDWGALCALAFLLGLRHGLDADHLTAIDGLTRLNVARQRAFARCCGALFSLGHGVVVIGVAATVRLMSERWAPPGWLGAVGAWISIGFLLAIAVANLRAVLRTPSGASVRFVGIRSRLFGRLASASTPWGVAGVGALFALSFDTFTQSAMFAATAARFGGIGHSLLLGALFVLGMTLADGLNGWLISRLVARADEIAAVASRVMSLSVSTVSLAVAAFGAASLMSPALEGWAEGKETALGLAVAAVVLSSYLIARWLGRERPVVQQQAA